MLLCGIEVHERLKIVSLKSLNRQKAVAVPVKFSGLSMSVIFDTLIGGY